MTIRLVAFLGAAAAAVLLVVAAPSLARAEIVGGSWSPVTCAGGMSPPPCYVANTPAGPTSTVINGTEWQQMVDRYAEAGYKYAGQSVPAEIAADAGKGGDEIATGLKAGVTEQVGTDVEAGAADLMTSGYFATFASAVGTVAAAGTAFYVGWQIGSAISSLFGLPGSEAGTYTPQKTDWAPGSYVAVNAGQTLYALTCGANATVCNHYQAPVNGFLVNMKEIQGANVGATAVSLTRCEKGAFCNTLGIHGEVGEKIVVEHTFSSGSEVHEGTTWIWFIPQARTPGTVVGARETKSSGALNAPTVGASRSGAEAVLRGTSKGDQEFNGWAYNHGGRPTGGNAKLAALADPLVPSKVAVPDCAGLLYAACAERIENAGLKAEHQVLGWQEADPQAQPLQVEELHPARATEVEKGTAVKVVTNPDVSGMPIVIPQPGTNETYDEYAARLNPALVPNKVILSDANEDPYKGPNAVSRTNPAAGTRVNPAASTNVDVQVNPSDAPEPIGGGSPGACNAAVPSIDWTPLNQPLGQKFPFGVFGFFTGWLSSWETGSGPPEWSVTFLPAGVFGSPHGLIAHINLGFMAPIVSVVRVVFLFAAFVGLLWFLATAAAKLQGDSS